MNEWSFVTASFVAGILASLACGLGALPLAIRGEWIETRVGLGYAFAGGLMIAASFYNLLMPAMTMGTESSTKLFALLQILAGLYLGCAVLWLFQKWLTIERLQSGILKSLGGRVSTLIFVAMSLHSIPEGIAVGVGYGAEGHHEQFAGLGLYIALAIAIHNIPEGLAVALPMRAEGASISKCFFVAFLTSLPQPLAAVPASLMVWFFKPLMLPMLGFAAGAMIYLVVVELIPDALETRSAPHTAWSFMLGFGLMILVQAAL